jgi:L-ribulose-5-phosphate 4-epimerase
MLEKLKQEVYEANMELPKRGLVTYTWGNASGIDRESNLFAIKPSGVEYGALKPEDMVIVGLDGKVVEGKYRPSSDTPTHVELYRSFKQIGGIVHTHSMWAASWAQAARPIPCYGTTQADYFYGEIPCARPLTEKEIRDAYEKNTGAVIVDYLKKHISDGIDVLAVPGILCAFHGPFTWGKDAGGAVYNAVVLEEIARMAASTELINKCAKPAPQYMVDKHYNRKHGPEAYYGQK